MASFQAESGSAAADAPFIAKVRKAGRDPATVLWVQKEAANGEVMVDPRHLTVNLSTNGHIWASPSAAPTAPLLQSKLSIFDLPTNQSKQTILLVIAVASHQPVKHKTNLDVLCDNPSLQLKRCYWLSI